MTQASFAETQPDLDPKAPRLTDMALKIVLVQVQINPDLFRGWRMKNYEFLYCQESL